MDKLTLFTITPRDAILFGQTYDDVIKILSKLFSEEIGCKGIIVRIVNAFTSHWEFRTLKGFSLKLSYADLTNEGLVILHKLIPILQQEALKIKLLTALGKFNYANII